MSSPEYSGTIEFPARFLDDEIKDCIVAHEHVDIALGDLVGLGDVEVKETDGIFRLHDREARNGEFYELENLLIAKGIPFDRESGMDWNAPACIRIFRPGDRLRQDDIPGQLDFLHVDGNPDAYEQTVSVSKLRELLATKSSFRGGSNAEAAANTIEKYLNEHFPAYPPL